MNNTHYSILGALAGLALLSAHIIRRRSRLRKRPIGAITLRDLKLQ